MQQLLIFTHARSHMNTDLESIMEHCREGQRLSEAEALLLSEKTDLLTLGRLAHARREQRFGRNTHYRNNLHIDYSNICTAHCLLCAYARNKGQNGAFTKTIDEILGSIRRYALAISEVHIVGGHHPDLPYAYYLDLLKNIRREFPKLHIKAFTAIEIHYFALKFGKSVSQILTDFIACGLNSLPGGGAEILVDEVRKKICPQKGASQVWLDVHKTAHKLGLTSTATMLYGHVESLADRVSHLEKIRRLQDETNGFTAFVPLPFHPANTALADIPPVTAHETLKMIALSRIFLDNIPHIKAYWVMLTMPVAQIALGFGADDLHGTVISEHISHSAGATTPQGYSENDLISAIKEAGGNPVIEN